ncbi:MAG: chaperonin family protein RbcX [Snowella sp.]|nr:chaperonin family protein RbcX [Snowella sp.]
MQPKQVAQATAKVLQSYLTYQAIRTIIDELSETNPPQAIWLSHYVANHNIQDGEAFLNELMTDSKELVLRILKVREHLADNVLDFLPEMVRTGISQANIEHQKRLLERLTQSSSETPLHPETADSEFDLNDSPEP